MLILISNKVIFKTRSISRQIIFQSIICTLLERCTTWSEYWKYTYFSESITDPLYLCMKAGYLLKSHSVYKYSIIWSIHWSSPEPSRKRAHYSGHALKRKKMQQSLGFYLVELFLVAEWYNNSEPFCVLYNGENKKILIFWGTRAFTWMREERNKCKIGASKGLFDFEFEASTKTFPNCTLKRPQKTRMSVAIKHN